LVIDCADPDRLARFCAAALGYELAPAPAGFATWNDFYRELGVPEEELVDGADRISDSEGDGPTIWFHVVPEGKVVKNRVHLDVRAGTGLVGAERLATLEAECARLVALGAARVRLLPADDENESCIVMQDIEGNEFCLD
jgi:hypothetical protein